MSNHKSSIYLYKHVGFSFCLILFGNQLAITSAINIQWLSTKCDNNICHTKQSKKFGQNIQQKCQVSQILAKDPSKIINHNILHTPSNVSVMVRKTFSHTPDEAMSGGLAKACDLEKIYSVEEKTSYFINLFML